MGANDDRVLLRKDIGSTFDEVMALGAEIEAALLAAGWPEDRGNLVRLLVVEHGANIVKHSSPLPGSVIHAQVTDAGDHCCLLFRDAGPAWDFEGRRRDIDRLPTYSESGRGLGIIMTIAERVEFRRSEGFNIALFTVARAAVDRAESVSGGET